MCQRVRYTEFAQQFHIFDLQANMQEMLMFKRYALIKTLGKVGRKIEQERTHPTREKGI